MAETRIGPQAGPQTEFLGTCADIAIYGGAAGGGKSFALMIECLRHSRNQAFGATIFRRTYAQVTQQGGLWDTATSIFPLLGAEPNQTSLTWRFPSKATVAFRHLQYEKDKLAYQGAQIALIGFDELTHFTETQFFYLLSRNRSACGVRPYVRATCNPDADSWVAEFIAWWIDQDTGYPIPERAGAIRYMGRDGDALIWGDTRDEVYQQAPHIFDPALKAGASLDDLIKSVTFIPSKLSDNPALMAKDPGYLGNLMSQPLVERERLLSGNWKVKPAAGLLFKRYWVEVIDAVPSDVIAWVRYWDRAATEEKPKDDPDWTVGVLMGLRATGSFVVAHVERFRESPLNAEENIKRTAANDAAMYGDDVEIGIEQDPGSAGKFEAAYYVRALAGYNVRVYPAKQSKVTRFNPFSAQCEGGNVQVVKGAWNEAYFSELEAFPQPKVHDDQVDGSSGAFTALLTEWPVDETVVYDDPVTISPV